MSIEITPIVRTFTYNGILLPDVPGLAPREVRDLYSAQFPELVSAEVEAGEVANGRQVFAVPDRLESHHSRASFASRNSSSSSGVFPRSASTSSRRVSCWGATSTPSSSSTVNRTLLARSAYR